MSKGEKVPLQFPITIDGVKHDALYLRRPQVADLLAVERSKGSEVEQDVAMLARLTGINPPDLEEVDLADYYKLNEKFAGFLSSNLKSLEGP